MTATAAVLDADLYGDDALADPPALWARIREAGPVVELPRHGLYAIGRHDDVRAALRDDAVFRSGHGVAANPVANRLGRDTTLASDGDVHTRRRRVLMRSLGGHALAGIEADLQAEADRLVDALLARPHFDAAADFAARLPAVVVADLVGIDVAPARMLGWAAATFDALGPLNRRGLRAVPRALGLQRFSRGLERAAVRPGSWADSVFDAHDAGELTLEEARALIVDFVAPALDTTILAATHLLKLLADHPHVLEELRADPSLTGAAVMETVRLASPIRGFTRRLASDATIGGVAVPAGARVVLLYAAANRDERRFADPDVPDLRRGAAGHLGWGNGPHACVGMLLAKLELKTLLDALVRKVDRVIAGTPTPLRNNTLQGISAMPARLLPRVQCSR